MNGVLNGFVVIGIMIVLGYLLARSGVLGPAAVEVLSPDSPPPRGAFPSGPARMMPRWIAIRWLFY